MKKLCLVMMFLVYASFTSAQYINWVVGGAGTGADKAATNAGHYDADTITWAQMQKTNGAALGFQVDAVSSNNGSGFVRLAHDGSLDDVIVGVGVIANFAQDESDDGYWLVTAIDVGGSTIDLAVGFVGDGENCSIVCGGALANPGDVPDVNDDANGDPLGPGDKVWVRAIAPYTAEDEGQSTNLYINQPGTNTDPIIWEAHFAEISSEKGDFGIATFNAQSTLANCIKTAISGSTYHVFIGFSLENATDDGANLNGETDDNTTFIRCRATLNGAWGIQGDNDNTFVFCDFDNNTTGGLDCDVRTRVINCVFRNATTDALSTQSCVAVGNLIFDFGDSGIRVNSTTPSIIYGNTIDGNDAAGTEGIQQDLATVPVWIAMNNILTDCVLGIQEDATIRQAAILYNNLYNSNTTDFTVANLLPNPTDGDNWGNIIDPANMFQAADSNLGDPYILHSTNKDKGVDAQFALELWDSFIAATNPPTLTGLSGKDQGGQERIETGAGGGGRTPGIGKGIGG